MENKSNLLDRQEILLSIIVPVYNVEKYLRDCLDSLLDQDISKEIYEIVCVDDGSPDNSYEVLQSYANKYSNVVIIRKENGGVSSARNLGISKARGKYIWFVDADDYIRPNCLKTIKTIIEEYDVTVVKIDYSSVDEEKSPSNIIPDDLSYSVINSAVSSPNVFTMIYNKEIIISNQILFNEQMKYGEDTLFQYFFYLFSERKHAKIDGVIYFYRSRNDSAMNLKTPDSYKKHCLDLIEMARVYKKIYDSGEIEDKRKYDETGHRKSEALQGALQILPKSSLDFNDTIAMLTTEGLYPFKRAKWRVKETKNLKAKLKEFIDSFVCYKWYYRIYYFLRKRLNIF